MEIVYTSKAYPGFKSQTLRQNYSSGACGRHFRIALRRGGRVVECGGLENRLSAYAGTRVRIPPPPPECTNIPAYICISWLRDFRLVLR